jgi:hypothetical protein
MKPIQSALAAFALASFLTPAIAEETKEPAKPAEQPAEKPTAEPATPAEAAPKKPAADPAKVFKRKDKDSDSFLSKEEFTKGAKDATKAGTAFDRKDKDKDGKLSLAEFTAKPKAKGKPKKQK